MYNIWYVIPSFNIVSLFLYIFHFNLRIFISMTQIKHQLPIQNEKAIAEIDQFLNPPVQ